MHSIHSQLLRGSTTLLVLAILSEQSSYGYDIMYAIEEYSKGVLEVSTASIYPILQQLQRKRLVRGTWKNVDGRNRKYYALTAKGRTEYRAQVREWKEYTQGMQAVLRAVQ